MVPGARFISTKGACTISFLTVLFTQFTNRTPVYRHHRAPAPLLVTIPTYRSLRAISISDNILTVHVEVILQDDIPTLGVEIILERRRERNGLWIPGMSPRTLSLFVLLIPTRCPYQRNGNNSLIRSLQHCCEHRRPTPSCTDG